MVSYNLKSYKKLTCTVKLWGKKVQLQFAKEFSFKRKCISLIALNISTFTAEPLKIILQFCLTLASE